MDTGGYPRPPAGSAVGYDRYSFTIHGRRVFLVSGEFHYWRLPAPDRWADVFSRMRAAGLNAVSIYFNWAYHSPARGIYDFEGIRDVERVLRAAAAAGLYVIARPGPCIYAETNGLGFPLWLLGSMAPARTRDPAFLAAVEQWFDRIMPILARHQVRHDTVDRRGVILVQLDNELLLADPGYVAALYRMARERGIVAPLFHNDAVGFGDYASVVDVSAKDGYPAGFDSRRPWTVATIARTVDRYERAFRDEAGQRHVPFFVAEFQGGAFDNYGGEGYQACYDWLGADFVAPAYKSLLSEGAAGVNTYMFYGGTNWGYLPDNLVYTSYDYGAPIREWLGLGPRYDATKRVMFFASAAGPHLAVTDRRTDLVRSSDPALLHRVRVNPESGATFVYLRNEDEERVGETKLTIGTGEGASRVPRNGLIHLKPRGMKVLLANYPASWGRLVHSTSELLTHEWQGEQETWVLWGDRWTSGETRLLIDGEVKAEVRASPGVRVTREAGALWLEYRHAETPHVVLAHAAGHEGHDLLLLLTDEAAASAFWRIPYGDGTLLALCRGFVGMGKGVGTIRIEARDKQRVTLFGGRPPSHLTVDGRRVALRPDEESGGGWFEVDGSRAALFQPDLPALTGWSYRPEPHEAAPGYDDAAWSAVDRFRSMHPDEHDFPYGFVWYRGRFAPTGEERAVRVLAHDSYAVWLDGRYLGRGDDGAPAVFALPHGLLSPGQDSTIAVLTESLGRGSGHDPMGVAGVEFLRDGDERRAPERVEVTIDRNAGGGVLEFSPEWTVLPDVTWERAPRLGADRAGARLRIRFRGPLLRVFGQWGAEAGQADVFVDGERAGEIDASAPEWAGGRGPLFERIGWDAGEHVADIVVTGQRRRGAGGPRFFVTAVEYGALPPPALPVEVSWRLIGADGDMRRGLAPMNASGLYGERRGWYLPPTGAANADADISGPEWEAVALPHGFRAADAWVGWYRASFELRLPPGLRVPLGLAMDGAVRGADKAVLFVNGYMLGRYWPARGPQTVFALPDGIVHHGPNTIAIAVWRRDSERGGLGSVRLAPYEVAAVSKVRLEPK